MSSTKNEITKIINNKAIQYVANKMAKTGNKEVVKTIKKHIKVEVYEAYNPIQYTRTYELLNSVELLESSASINTLRFRYGHNLDGMNSYSPTENPPMGRAWSLAGQSIGSDVSSVLPYLLHDGKSGKIITSDIDWYKPKPYMTKAKEEIERELLHKLFS